MDMTKYRELFLSEAREHINNLNTLVVKLEEAPENRETVEALFREAHSIKGMAATMGFDVTAGLAHHLEDFLEGFQRSGPFPRSIIDYLIEGVDLLEMLLIDIRNNQDERDISLYMSHPPRPPAGNDSLLTTGPPPDTSLQSSITYKMLIVLRQNVLESHECCVQIINELHKLGKTTYAEPNLSKLPKDAVVKNVAVQLRSSQTEDQIEAALLRISGIETVQFDSSQHQQTLNQHEESFRTIRVQTDLVDHFVNLSGELISQRNMLENAAKNRNWGDLQEALGQAGELIDELNRRVVEIRLMPFNSIAGRLPRIIRDLCRDSDKQATLHLSGTDVSMDRTILEKIGDPLVHLVRNAVDHGIQDKGNITVSARREKNQVLIEVSDDGKGIDPEAIRQKAVSTGLINQAQADRMSDRDILMFVCHPGLSTAALVTEISGRGVGMNVVKSVVSDLGGTLDILSSPGKGTKFQMQLPISVAVIKILCFDCHDLPLAIPLARVRRTFELSTTDIFSSETQPYFKCRGENIPLFSVAELLSMPAPSHKESVLVILHEFRGRYVGLQVDSIGGQREAFIKPVGFPINLLTGLNGATIDGNGRVIFLVEPHALLESAHLGMVS